jgi:hypothetical protein
MELSEFGCLTESKSKHPTRNASRNPLSCIRDTSTQHEPLEKSQKDTKTKYRAHSDLPGEYPPVANRPALR